MPKFHIIDEFSPLEYVLVASASVVPEKHSASILAGDKHQLHDEKEKWDVPTMVEQQRQFLDVLRRYGVTVDFTHPLPGSPYQIFTRDIGFVYEDTFYYNRNRTLEKRQGEFEAAAPFLTSAGKLMPIETGKLEGGDVLVDKDRVYVGLSNRTTHEAIQELESHLPVPVKGLTIGEKVMHLDTRMNILPRKYLLIHPEAFSAEDQRYLSQRFEFVPITAEEAAYFATNVLTVNPETIIVEKRQERLQRVLRERGFIVEAIDYSEPQVLLGSFRCTTLPLQRKKMLHRGVDFEKYAERLF